MYYPQMVIHKMVYKAIPPLYALKANGKDKYFTDQRDIVKYIQRSFQQKYSITYMDGSPLTNTELTNLFMVNNDYIYWLKDMIAGNYSIDPKLLEMVLYNYIENGNSINQKKLEKEITKAYRFMGVQKVKDSYIVSGTIDKSYFLPFNDIFVNDNCKEYFDILSKNKALRYKVNGQAMTLLDIMSLYKSISPSGIQRFKGLGEMEAYQLKESTLYPGSDRTLICYTMEDAKAELEAIREYESDMKKFLKLAKNVTRDDLID